MKQVGRGRAGGGRRGRRGRCAIAGRDLRARRRRGSQPQRNPRHAHEHEQPAGHEDHNGQIRRPEKGAGVTLARQCGGREQERAEGDLAGAADDTERAPPEG